MLLSPRRENPSLTVNNMNLKYDDRPKNLIMAKYTLGQVLCFSKAPKLRKFSSLHVRSSHGAFFTDGSHSSLGPRFSLLNRSNVYWSHNRTVQKTQKRIGSFSFAVSGRCHWGYTFLLQDCE